jgi:dsDNA-specific endonuclease/ATPase MutS2
MDKTNNLKKVLSPFISKGDGNSKMEAVVASCIESMKRFNEMKDPFQSWKQMHRLTERSEIFHKFLNDLSENPTMLNDLSQKENEIILGIQKTFRAVEALHDKVQKRKTFRGFTEPQFFLNHLKEVAAAFAMIEQYGEDLNVLDDPDLTQIRTDDLNVSGLSS